MKVVIIEDNPEIAEAIVLCLQTFWPKIEYAVSGGGNEGINLVKTRQPALVLLDINLPDIDGFEVLKSIRAFSAVPVVILTVRATEKDKKRGNELGATDYITKPFKARELADRLRKYLEEKKEK